MGGHNHWDKLSKQFDTHSTDEEIDSRVADNVLIAWPPIIEQMDKKFPDKKGLKAVDFGCGTGSFCSELHKLGFTVTGIDYSSEMVNVARKHSPKDITYIKGSFEQLTKPPKQDLVVSIMTLQFIEDIDKTMQHIATAIKPGGLLVFGVFNPEWVTQCLKAKVAFADFDSVDSPRIGMKTFGAVRLPVYIRTALEYDEA